jgi:coproporphyrinogen III oxidase
MKNWKNILEWTIIYQMINIDNDPKLKKKMIRSTLLFHHHTKKGFQQLQQQSLIINNLYRIQQRNMTNIITKQNINYSTNNNILLLLTTTSIAIGMTWSMMNNKSPLSETTGKTDKNSIDFKQTWESTVRQMQHNICTMIERVDGKSKFMEDVWQRKEGGGGWTRVLKDGDVFEKAGVNVSTVFGELPPEAQRQMKSRGVNITGTGKAPFFACGISLVIHPKNPMAPTIHANYRFFELTDPQTNEKIWWFGGGSDLTPSYLFEEDAIEFHQAYKDACDKHDPTFYKKFKKWCDEYFFITHRGEARGIGGIFFDDLDSIGSLTSSEKSNNESQRKEALRQFAIDCCNALIKTYEPIMNRRKNMSFDQEQKRWQQLRWGRYVEFNLAIDRGTRFGLQTPGSRIESILMSLPETARWEYGHVPKPGSREELLLNVLRKPKDWV